MMNQPSATDFGVQVQFRAEQVSVDDLHLDPRNPRILMVGEDIEEERILEILWREYSVEEIALSIAQNGYFPHEPLFVAEEGRRMVVIEGNRRLAAVRVLRDGGLRQRLNINGNLLFPISEARTAELAALPVIRCGRDRIWQYVGFKHVNGPQAWTSLAKAEYIAWVRNDLGVDLTDIAGTIGDTHFTVARLYRAYAALKQAEDAGVYHRNRRSRKHFAFSHLYTGLDYPGIGAFTQVADLKSPTDKPIPTDRLKNFGELCGWLWGDSTRDQEVLIKSQNPNLRELDDTLDSEDGVVALRAGLGLQRSLNVARGDTALFREALINAKQALKNARATVVTGYAGEPDLKREIREIVSIADALYDDVGGGTVERRQRRRDGRKG